MQLVLNYDAAVDAWTMTNVGLLLRDERDLADWEAQLRRELRRLRGERVYLLVDLTGVTLEPSLTEAYSRVIKSVVIPSTLGVVRYGASGGLTAATIRVSAIRNRYPAHLFPDRAAALEAVAHIRALPEGASG